jgi:hypothetical protein
MKTYGGVKVYIHVFLTSALVAGEWLASHSGRFTLREPPVHLSQDIRENLGEDNRNLDPDMNPGFPE